MRKYDIEKQQAYFAQGFRIGLVFGVLGALIILGRDHSPKQTLPEPEPVVATLDTPTETPAIPEIPAPEIPAPGPIAQG